MVLVSVAEFWAPLLALFEHMRGHGFIREGLDLSYLVAREAAEVVPLLRAAGHEPDPKAESIVQQRM